MLAWPPTTTLAWPPTVDTTLASVATNHVGVKKNAQRAAERGGSQEHRKKPKIEVDMVAGEDIVALQALKALKAVQIVGWVAEATCRGNMAWDEYSIR